MQSIKALTREDMHVLVDLICDANEKKMAGFHGGGQDGDP